MAKESWTTDSHSIQKNVIVLARGVWHEQKGFDMDKAGGVDGEGLGRYYKIPVSF